MSDQERRELDRLLNDANSFTHYNRDQKIKWFLHMVKKNMNSPNADELQGYIDLIS
jgi:hypothetical protein